MDKLNARKRECVPPTSGGRAPSRLLHAILSQRDLESAEWLIVAGSLLLRWLVARHDFSGKGQPPHFGDFEAQRHWLEVTLHLPARQWYYYDLEWWGLDYPPLTAFVSYAFGAVAHAINPAWVALQSSRGHASLGLVAFMRASVVIGDLLVYYPAVYYFTAHVLTKWTVAQRTTAKAVLLGFPGLLLIDHGHFQYNSIMLGLVLWSVSLIHTEHNVLGAIAFTLALLFKQMSLYFALPVFFFLLARCFRPRGRFALFAKLGLAVISTAGLLIYPFRNNLPQMIYRVFPVARGLYEDKVANVWCAMSPVIKFQGLFAKETMLRVSLAVTLIASLPSCIGLFRHPSTYRLLLSLAAVSFAFFLFSFQVHEKTILLPILPVTLLLIVDRDRTVCRWRFWNHLINVSVFSMYPLLKRDGLVIPYITLILLWNCAIGDACGKASTRSRSQWEAFAAKILYASCVGIHTCELFLAPPARLPHLFVLLNACLSCGVFALGWMYTTYLTATESYSLKQ